MQKFKIFLIAGEESGDINAFAVMNELKKLVDFRLYGTGGEKLQSLNQLQYFDIKEMEIIGIDGVFRKLPFVIKMFYSLKKRIDEIKPDVVIMVDYPGFNIRFAKTVKMMGYPVIYYIAPQVWAWHSSRVKKIKKYVDLLLCILPFEEQFFKNNMINAKYVGNPLTERITPLFEDKKDFYNSVGLNMSKKTIGILPGSRTKEVKNLLPDIAKVADVLSDQYQFVLGKAGSVGKELIMNYIKNTNIKLVKDGTYDIMNFSDLLWICSGTATLEAAIIQTPMIIFYKTGLITEFLGRIFVKLRYIGLPNIILDKEAVPELIGKDVNQKNIIFHTRQLLSMKEKVVEDLSKISNLFSERRSSLIAAKEIYSFLSK